MKTLIAAVCLLSAWSAAAQETTGRFIQDRTTGCKVWSDPYSARDSISWSGQCRAGFADGVGTLIWYEEGKSIAQYTGAVQRGVPGGEGKYVVAGFGILEGTFKNGVLHGNGKITQEDGGVLKGNFTEGQLLDLDMPYLQRLQKIGTLLRDTSGIYTGDRASTRLFYYLLPPRRLPKATLVLFPSTGESAESVVSSNKDLMQQASEAGILTVVVSANYNKDLNYDQLALSFFNHVFAELVAKHGAPPDKFILSGLSLGGNNALRYTEMSRDERYTTRIKPIAVIGVDPPVDNAALYARAREAVEKYKDSTGLSPAKRIALDEAVFLLDYYTKLYGGPPEDHPQRYIQGSQYSRSQQDGGNARYLRDVPVRIYTDPDILWQMRVKGRDYYRMNCLDQSAMILLLQELGNTRAEFIPALGKGYRLDGTRHPHSWSIVAPEECVAWMLRCIE